MAEMPRLVCGARAHSWWCWAALGATVRELLPLRSLWALWRGFRHVYHFLFNCCEGVRDEHHRNTAPDGSGAPRPSHSACPCSQVRRTTVPGSFEGVCTPGLLRVPRPTASYLLSAALALRAALAPRRVGSAASVPSRVQASLGMPSEKQPWIKGQCVFSGRKACRFAPVAAPHAPVCHPPGDRVWVKGFIFPL